MENNVILNQYAFSQINVTKCKFTWIIYNYEFIKNEEDKEIQISSPAIKAGSNDEFIFLIVLYPQGIGVSNATYVSTRIWIHAPTEELQSMAEFEMSILSNDGSEEIKFNSGCMRIKENNYNIWEIEDFIKRSILQEDKCKLLTHSNLTIVFKVTIKTKSDIEISTKVNELQSCKRKMKVSFDMEQIYKNPFFWDAILISRYQSSFKVHVAILSERCPKLLLNLKRATTKSIYEGNLVEFCPLAVVEMLRFIYSGKVNNICYLKKDLLKIADKYDIIDLKLMCEVAYCECLSVYNALDILTIANLYNANNLKREIISFINAHLSNYYTSYSPLLVNRKEEIPNQLNKFEGNSKSKYCPSYLISYRSCEDKRWGISRLNLKEFNYTWVINNFSLLLNKNTGESISSPVLLVEKKHVCEVNFESHKNDLINNAQNHYLDKWFLRLYPNGCSADTKGYMSLFFKNMRQENIGFDYTFQYEFCILNREKKKINIVTSGIKNASKQSEFCGKEKMYIKRDILINKNTDLVVDDTLTIMCTVKMLNYTVTSCGQNTPLHSEEVDRILKISDNLSNLSKNSTYTDFTLITRDKKMYMVHKFVLVARSHYFKYKLFSELNATSMEIDVDSNVAEECIRFIYTGTVEDISEIAKDVYKAAIQYELEDLGNLCIDTLCKNLKITTAPEILNFSEMYKAWELKRQVVNFINKNLSEIIKNFLPNNSETLNKMYDLLINNRVN